MTDEIKVEIPAPETPPAPAPVVVVTGENSGGDAVEAEYMRQLAEKETQITELTAAVADRDATIETLNSQLDEWATRTFKAEEEVEQVIEQVAEEEAAAEEEASVQAPPTDDVRPDNEHWFWK